jgi:UDP-N-acetylglucosamine/UDP-N-acetylgalactosamine diphosphorylase
VPVIRADERVEEARARGVAALDAGKVAALLVAGGQGSRLGFEHPKGMYPVGPVTQKTLFQIHAEKVLALSRRHRQPIPLLVMTSDATHAETEAFFAEHRFFGLPADQVFFFRQGTMPALDLATGRLLFEEPGKLFTSPNGHGGTLTALADSGLLDKLRGRGIEHHLAANAEVSSKIIPKLSPTDKLGNLVLVDGRCTIIEYSDLPEALARATDAAGKLRIWAGSPAIHWFAVEFLARITQGTTRLPFHVAKKKVPHVDCVKPETENALKFEMFIFDALPMADRWTVVETSRREEFEPLKNATGPDSPATVAQAQSDLAADWLRAAGVTVPLKPDGHTAVALEVSPLFALDAAELATKVDRGMKIEGPTYLGD